MLVVPVSSSINGPEFIINFPTKAHWRFPSQLSWIKAWLTDLFGQKFSPPIHQLISPVCIPVLISFLLCVSVLWKKD